MVLEYLVEWFVHWVVLGGNLVVDCLVVAVRSGWVGC